MQAPYTEFILKGSWQQSLGQRNRADTKSYVPTPAASLSKMDLRKVASIVCPNSCCVPLQDGYAQCRLYCMSQILLRPSPRWICAMSPLLYVNTPAASLSKMDLRKVASIVCPNSCCVPLQDVSAQCRLYCMSQLLLRPSPRWIVLQV